MIAIFTANADGTYTIRVPEGKRLEIVGARLDVRDRPEGEAPLLFKECHFGERGGTHFWFDQGRVRNLYIDSHSSELLS